MEACYAELSQRRGRSAPAKTACRCARLLHQSLNNIQFGDAAVAEDSTETSRAVLTRSYIATALYPIIRPAAWHSISDAIAAAVARATGVHRRRTGVQAGHLQRIAAVQPHRRWPPPPSASIPRPPDHTPRPCHRSIGHLLVWAGCEQHRQRPPDHRIGRRPRRPSTAPRVRLEPHNPQRSLLWYLPPRLHRTPKYRTDAYGRIIPAASNSRAASRPAPMPTPLIPRPWPGSTPPVATSTPARQPRPNRSTRFRIVSPRSRTRRARPLNDAEARANEAYRQSVERLNASRTKQHPAGQPVKL